MRGKQTLRVVDDGGFEEKAKRPSCRCKQHPGQATVLPVIALTERHRQKSRRPRPKEDQLRVVVEDKQARKDSLEGPKHNQERLSGSMTERRRMYVGPYSGEAQPSSQSHVCFVRGLVSQTSAAVFELPRGAATDKKGIIHTSAGPDVKLEGRCSPHNLFRRSGTAERVNGQEPPEKAICSEKRERSISAYGHTTVLAGRSIRQRHYVYMLGGSETSVKP